MVKKYITKTWCTIDGILFQPNVCLKLDEKKAKVHKESLNPLFPDEKKETPEVKNDKEPKNEEKKLFKRKKHN